MPIHDWTRVGPGTFHAFHFFWTSTLCETLNAGVLPRGYFALPEQEAAEREPDVIAYRDSLVPPLADPGEAGSAAVAVATQEEIGIEATTEPPAVPFTARSEEDRYARRRRRVSILTTEGTLLVAVIEIASPGNKSSRDAFDEFVNKAVTFLRSGVHLLVLDLFPPTARDPQGVHQAIWSRLNDDRFELPHEKPLTFVSYSGGVVKNAFIYPVAVGDPLPLMPLFLRPERYVNVPLDASYHAAFARMPELLRGRLEPPANGG